MKPLIFFETGQGHIDGHGGFFGEIQRTTGGRAAAIWPLHPGRTTPLRRNGRKVLLTYVKRQPGEDQPFEPRHLLPGDYLHIPSFSPDGFRGYSMIGLARETIGAAIAREQFQAEFFANGAKMSAVFKHPSKLSDEAYDRLKGDLERSYSGLENHHRIALLEDGLDVKTLGMPMADAQFIEQIKLGDLAICRLFDVPPHKVGILDRASFSNITEQNLEWATQAVAPMAIRWEQALTDFVSSDGHEVRFNVDALHRADIKTRMDAHGVAVQWGFRTRDEIRELEELAPLPEGQGGGETWMPQTHAPAAKIIATPIKTLPEHRADILASISEQRRIIAPFVAELAGRSARRFEQALQRNARKDVKTVDIERIRQAARRDLEPSFMRWARSIRGLVGHESGTGPEFQHYVRSYLEAAVPRLLDPQNSRGVESRIGLELTRFANQVLTDLDVKCAEFGKPLQTIDPGGHECSLEAHP